jgi:hypothetical protein
MRVTAWDRALGRDCDRDPLLSDARAVALHDFKDRTNQRRATRVLSLSRIGAR